MGVEVVPWLKGWYSPAMLFIEVLIFSEQITCLSPVFNLSCHDVIGWLGLVPCLNHSERILEFGNVVSGVFWWALLLADDLHSGGSGGLFGSVSLQFGGTSLGVWVLEKRAYDYRVQ